MASLWVGVGWCGVTIGGGIYRGGNITCSQGLSVPIATFGVITDNHYNETENNKVENVTLAVNTWNNQSMDFIVSLGDMIDDASSPANATHELLNLNNFEAEMNKFKGSKYSVVGNHDTEVLGIAGYTANSTILKETYSSFNLSGAHFVLLFGYDAGGFFEMSQTQLNWLSDDLNATSLPTVVFIHQGIELDYPGNTGNVTDAGDDANQLASWNLIGEALANSNKFRWGWNLTNSGVTRTVSLYNGTTLVARGTRDNNGVLDFTQQGGSGLSGNVTVTYTADDQAPTNNVTAGEFLAWPYSDYCYNSNAIRTVLEAAGAGKVFLVMRGHGHTNREQTVNGINYYETFHSQTGSYRTVTVYNNTSYYLTGYGSASSARVWPLQNP